MTTLTAFRDHARAMSTAEHKPDCPHVTWSALPDWSWVPGEWAGKGRWVQRAPRPECAGCLTQADRDLFARLADEVDHYLAPADDTALFA